MLQQVESGSINKLAFALLTLGTLVGAQVPDGWLVASSYRAPGTAGLGGLYFVDPRSPTNVVAVTNLPPEVTGQSCPASSLCGSDLVLRLPDGRIATTGWGIAGLQHPLFVLTLSGSAVTAVARYDLGTITNLNGFAVPQAALLPDGRILVAVDRSNLGVPGEPLNGALLGIVDPNLPPTDPQAVQVVPVASLPAGQPNGLAFDANTGRAYIGLLQGIGASIYRVPVAGGTPAFVAAVPGCNALALDSAGRLLVGYATGFSTGGLLRLEAGALVPFPQVTQLVNALREEPATGDLYLVQVGAGPAVARLAPASVGGTLTPLTLGPPSGWGYPSGLDIDPNPETYGAGSGGPPQVEWDLAPNTGGLPTLGNAAFGLQLQASAPPAFSYFVLSTSPANTQLFGLEVLVGLVQFTGFAFASGTTMQVPLAIPASSPLEGTLWFGQTLHAFGNGALSSSPGVRFTVL